MICQLVHAMKTAPLLCLFIAAAVVVRADDALEIVQRSLPFVKEKGAAWIEKRQCASCHQIPAMLWGLNKAARLGLEVDRSLLAWQTAFATDWRHWNNSGDKDGVDKVSAGNIDTMNFLLLGRDEEAEDASVWTGEFRAQLLKNQLPDGSWKPGGQLPLTKRSAREMSEVTTMWTLLALRSYGDEKIPAEVLQRAEGYLAAAQPGQSTEWHAARLLLQPKNETLRDELLKLQHADGGWGWLASEPGDALGTGYALYALARSGLPATHEAMQRAVAFLKTTQKPDGSWDTPSTRARDKNKVIPTSIYWGTAWAVTGLLEARSGPASTP